MKINYDRNTGEILGYAIEGGISEPFIESDDISEDNVFKHKVINEKLVPLTEDEISQVERHEKEILLREKRGRYLSVSDKYMLVDFPLSDEERGEVSAYRQALRTITEEPGWPDIVLPKPPEKIKDEIGELI